MLDLPQGWKAIENKWIIIIKWKANGFIERYKAYLVVKCDTQQKGINYEEIFSPIVRVFSIHLIQALIINLDLELHQMDVKIAFLNGELVRKSTCNNQ